MPWKKLKVDRGWPATWQRCGKNASGHPYCVMMEKMPNGDFRWGWTQRANDVDPINGWVKTIRGTAREAKRQAEEYLRYLVGKGGTLGRTLSPSSDFDWLLRDARLAFKRHDCDEARTITTKLLLKAKTPAQQETVYRMQNAVRRCVLKHGDLEGASRRRRRRRAAGPSRQ